MRTALPLPGALLTLAAALTVAGVLGADCERRLFPGTPEGADRLFSQDSDEPQPGSAGQASQRIREAGDAMAADYKFRNFNQDTLTISFSIKKAAFSAYSREFGYSETDLAELKAWHENA